MNSYVLLILTILGGVAGEVPPGTGQNCPVITAWHGSFIPVGDLTGCKFYLNGLELSEMDLKTTRGYGLLQVMCASCEYNVVSPFSVCDDCAICTHNEGVEQCRSLAVPVGLAVLISCVLTIALIPTLSWLDKKYNLVHAVITQVHKHKRVKADRRTKKLRPIVEMELNRLNVNAAVAPEYMTLTSKSPVPPPRPSPRPRSPSPTASMILAALALTTSTARACDNTLLMSSEGLVVENQTTTSYNTGLTVLHTGATLCLKYPDSSEEKIKLVSITSIQEYIPLYRACDFNISTTSTYNCLGAGECWDESTCTAGYIKASLRGSGPHNPNEFYDCALVPNLSTSHCTHEQICIWYKWTVVPLYSKCDPILALQSESETLHFEFSDRAGNVLPFTLSASNPQISKPTTMHLINVFSEPEPLSQYLRNHAGTYYKTKACDLNNPIPGLLGDMQVNLQKEQSTYPEWAVQCKPDGSRVRCNTATPGYQTSLKENLQNKVTIHSQNLFSVSVKSARRGHASLMFRTPAKPSMVVEQARCSVKVEYVYGCTACLEAPFIIISTFDIEATGVLRFESNCSFYLNEISCSSRPQRLQMTEKADHCQLAFKGTNSSLQVEIPYEFRGEVFSMGIVSYKSEETFGEKVSLGVQSPAFIQSLQVSLGVGAILTCVTTLMRSAMRYAAFRAGRNAVGE